MSSVLSMPKCWKSLGLMSELDPSLHLRLDARFVDDGDGTSLGADRGAARKVTYAHCSSLRRPPVSSPTASAGFARLVGRGPPSS
jgi:hypothetical protein